jgi:hypothetical protein
MPKNERLRDILSGSPTLEYLNQMSASGWKLIALEWERETGEETPDPVVRMEEVPYGLQVADDGRHLMENQAEMRVLMSAVNMFVDDRPVSGVAEELNRLGYRDRSGDKWTPSAVFELIPRMIEAGPKIFAKDEWAGLRSGLKRRLPSI